MDIQYISLNLSPSFDWWEQLPAIASGIIALLALGVSFYQYHLSKTYNKLSVTPHLALHARQENGIYTIELRNDGIGPAKIESAIITHKGKVVEGKGIKLIENAVRLVPNCQFLEGEFFNSGFMLPSRDKVILARVRYTVEIEDFDQHLSNHLKIFIQYKSIYGEDFDLESEQKLEINSTHS